MYGGKYVYVIIINEVIVAAYPKKYLAEHFVIEKMKNNTNGNDITVLSFNGSSCYSTIKGTEIWLNFKNENS